MKTVTKWAVSDVSKAIQLRSNTLEFQDDLDEWHDFTIIATPDRIVFGGVCNAGFLESGYIIREDGESLDETAQQLLFELQTYYNHGSTYVSRIVVNERM